MPQNKTKHRKYEKVHANVYKFIDSHITPFPQHVAQHRKPYTISNSSVN